MNPMGDVPAPGSEAPPLEEEALALVPGAGTCPGPSGDTGESVEPQAVAATGSPAAPEQAPTALGLSILEQVGPRVRVGPRPALVHLLCAELS